MAMSLNIYCQADRTLVGWRFEERRLAIIDLFRSRLIKEIKLDCDIGVWQFSGDGNSLVVGTADGEAIFRLNWQTGERTEHLYRGEIWNLMPDMNGNVVLIQTSRNKEAVDLRTTERVRIPNIDRIRGGYYEPASRSFRLPSLRRGKIVTVETSPLRIGEISGLADSRIADMAIDDRGMYQAINVGCRRLDCRRVNDNSLVWSWTPKGRIEFDTPQFFNGDRLISLNAVEIQSTIVIDAESGEEVKRVPYLVGDYVGGMKFLKCDGTMFDLETEKVSNGVSKSDWWRGIGL